MANPTSPLNPSDTEVVLYEQRIRARLVGSLLGALIFIVTLWTFRPPELPGDMAGTIVGGLLGFIGGLLTNWGVKSH